MWDHLCTLEKIGNSTLIYLEIYLSGIWIPVWIPIEYLSIWINIDEMGGV